MDTIYNAIHGLLKSVPEIALFTSLALGFLVGKIKFGKFQLGGVAGSLLMAVLVSQFGVHIDDGVKSTLFALFIFAVGYTSGPQFIRSLGKQSIKEIILSIVLASSALATVVVLAKLFHLDKGIAAGIASGGLTQSAIIGTAESAIRSLSGLAPEAVNQMVANISVGYGVTYIFGSFGPIIIIANLLQKFMGRTIRDDAMAAEASIHSGGLVLGEGQQLAVPTLIGRIYKAGPSAGMTIETFEQNFGMPPVTIERVLRDGSLIGLSPQKQLLENDTILLVGKRNALLVASEHLGPEIPNATGMELILQTRDVVIDSDELHEKTLGTIRDNASPEMRHGLYVTSLSRDGKHLPVTAETIVKRGDIITLYGAEQDVRRASTAIGYSIVPGDKTDIAYMGFGIVVGLLIGHIVVHAGNIPVTLGSGGGALLSGLFFGWMRTRHMKIGEMPGGAAQLMKDLGLAGFVTVVGLNYGMNALTTVKAQGVSIFVIGMLVTIIPLLITMVVGKYILRYNNVAIFAGALCGARSANPAFGEVLNKAENSVPTAPFAITYALANVFLTLLGPLVVALV